VSSFRDKKVVGVFVRFSFSAGIRAYNVLPLLQVSKRYFLILLNLEKQ
jgi:hypothetical protein